MFLSSSGFNYTNTNYNDPAPPPSPRKTIAPVQTITVNSTSHPAMVTPRYPLDDTPGENTSQTEPISNNNSNYNSVGFINHRRGASSADMPEPEIHAIHEPNSSTNQQMNQVTMPIEDSNHHQLSVAPHKQYHIHLAAPHAQQQLVNQQQLKHSYLSSMDLMSSSSSFKQSAQGNNTIALGMFKSSSHHTSHAAVAGDLLSMSRTMDSPSSSEEQNKKRAASYGWTTFSDMMMLSSNNTFGAQQQQQQEQQHTTASVMWNLSPQPTFSANQASAGSFIGASNPASNFPQQLQDNEESHQSYMNKRRRRRSDSFEMMDD